MTPLIYRLLLFPSEFESELGIPSGIPVKFSELEILGVPSSLLRGIKDQGRCHGKRHTSGFRMHAI